MARSLAEWLAQIQQVHPVGWDLGLERVGEVGRKLGVTHPARTVFLVAGTNGKGSTCEFLANLCWACGLSYGKTTSPFLQRYNEQFEVNRQYLDDAAIIGAFEAIDAVRGEITLTYFEYGALAAMYLFKQANLDVAILEIGLGGRLDAMNIADPDVSIITKVDIDHVDWLGADRETIAIEKAGIMRSAKPVVLVDPDPPQALFTEASNLGALTRCLNREFEQVGNQLVHGGQVFPLPALQLPAPGASAAVEAFLCAGLVLTAHQVEQALADAKLPGRFQRLPTKPVTILDVAHNPNAAKYLADKLRVEGGSYQAVTAMYADKDVEAVFDILAPFITGWHLADLDLPRAASAAELREHLSHCCGSVGETYAKVAFAYEGAREACGPHDGILVFGSFPVVAEVLTYLGLDASPS